MKLLLLVGILSVVSADRLKPTCERPIYCNSQLLHLVQTTQLFSYSKYFVDMHMKSDEKTILSNFDILLSTTDGNPTREQLEKFVYNYFEEVDELDKWTPSDYSANPAFLDSIKDEKLRKFAQDVHKIWLILGVKVKSVVHENPDRYSLIPTSHGFIIPGGKFSELYYWDTYWIIEGLLVSGMKDTVKGIISNLVELQRKFGHIPNGARWYYQERSQPPLLSAMVMLYLRATGDTEFLKEIIDSLESEADYWLDTHTKTFKVNKNEYTLLRYYAPSEGCRPESYYADYTNSQVFSTEEEKRNYYISTKSAAESGWDFSTRWFVDENGENTGNITTMKPYEIIPVDLNAIFANVLQNLANFHAILRNPRKGAHWAQLAKLWRHNIKNVFWNDEDGVWYDWDSVNNQHRKYFYVSNIAPLWMNVVDRSFIDTKGQAVIDYLKKMQVLDPFKYPGGVPASLIRSGQQWDFPNAWPPLVSMMVGALEAIDTKEATELAFDVAQTWVRANYKGFQETNEMFEKYDVEQAGKIGGGGEYEVVIGFGWSNGVVLEFLSKYGSRLTAQDNAVYSNNKQ